MKNGGFLCVVRQEKQQNPSRSPYGRRAAQCGPEPAFGSIPFQKGASAGEGLRKLMQLSSLINIFSWLKAAYGKAAAAQNPPDLNSPPPATP